MALYVSVRYGIQNKTAAYNIENSTSQGSSLLGRVSANQIIILAPGCSGGAGPIRQFTLPYGHSSGILQYFSALSINMVYTLYIICRENDWITVDLT